MRKTHSLSVLVIVVFFVFFTEASPSGFAATAAALTIDPTYAWHTFYGSSVSDEGYTIATDVNGNVYVTGISDASWNGPAGQSPLHAYSGGFDFFVLKLDSSGAYQWHTFYGSIEDYGYGVATDASGNVYVTGISSASWNGPSRTEPAPPFHRKH